MKPENLVLDKDGYLYLTDLGIAKKQPCKDTSGTPGYMAPEVMHNLEHGFEADFFAIGVILHEFITGKVVIIMRFCI